MTGRVDALAVFAAAPNPQNAVALARADQRVAHRALSDWAFVDQLNKAEERCIAYPKLVEQLKATRDLLEKRDDEDHVVGPINALLREIGEAP